LTALCPDGNIHPAKVKIKTNVFARSIAAAPQDWPPL
jgi:hypothetical protein